MRVEFIKNCLKHNKGAQIEIRDLFARVLIKHGIAVEVEPTYKLADLCYASMYKVVDKQINKQYSPDEPKGDIDFDTERVGYGIFQYQKPKYFDYMFDEGDCYTRISSGSRHVSERYAHNLKIKIGDVIVKYRSVCTMLEAFPDRLQKLGWTKDTVLTRTQISEFEKSINQKYKVAGFESLMGY